MLKHYIENGSGRLEVVIIGGLGDCILMTPYITELDGSGRYTEISCLAMPEARELFDANPHVTSFVAFERVQQQLMTIYHARDYDCLHNLGLARKASVAKRHCLELNEEFYGFMAEDRTPQIWTKPEDVEWAQQVAKKIGRPFVLITTDAGWEDKRYPHENWQPVINHITRTHAVIEIGRNRGAIQGTEFITPLPSLRKTTAIAKMAEAIICPDTYLGHLALAVDNRAIVLFGPTNKKVWGHKENINLSSDSCLPCTQIDDQFKTRNDCSDNICIKSISPAEIIKAFEDIVAKRQVSR